MNVTIRNIDGDLYRRIKAHAARTGQTVAAVVEQAAEAWLAAAEPARRRRRLADLEPVDLGPGTERTSEEIDDLLYGASRS